MKQKRPVALVFIAAAILIAVVFFLRIRLKPAVEQAPPAPVQSTATPPAVAEQPMPPPSKPIPSPDDPGAHYDLFAAADPESGARVAEACMVCHSFKPGTVTKGKVGPNLYGLYERHVGSVEGFDYSEALIALRTKTWTIDKLDAWLASPQEFAPGTKMTFGGLLDAQERMDLIAYLMTLR